LRSCPGVPGIAGVLIGDKLMALGISRHQKAPPPSGVRAVVALVATDVGPIAAEIGSVASGALLQVVFGII